MSRRHPKRRMTGKHFAQVPVEVLTSDACRTLPHYAKVVLFAVAATYRGANNGDLALPYSVSRTFGITSKWQLIDGLALLIDRGLIEKTRQGGKKPLGPCLYAITWQPISDLGGKIASGATTAASNAWAQWKSAPPEDQSAINQQHPRRTTSAPQEDQMMTKSAPPEDQTGAFIGTPGGSPSRISREGAGIIAREHALSAGRGRP